MNNLSRSIREILRRAGAGFAAAQQGEYLHGWLPAMAERPASPLSLLNDTAHLPKDSHAVPPGHAGCAGAH